ncbi:hypothetical protein WJX73_002916 [Symbiochloris irregularis]|uniref:CENP-V/GFA domain-containing protein n=1 Tax=Symbiochloris irregularis TaxID=706552 RepID=A0AAW1PY09_9CHLO
MAAAVETDGPALNIGYSCNCGAVHISVSGEPIIKAICHCSDCQAWWQRDCLEFEAYPEAVLVIDRGQDKVQPFVIRNPHLSRCWCKDCGTRVFSHGTAAKTVIVPAIPGHVFEPTLHLFWQDATDSSKRRFEHDDLPKLTEPPL